MLINRLIIEGCEVETYTLNTVIVGTGAAGYKAADSLYDLGQKDIAIVTEDREAGTSRNTGSDKQTYYKLTLSGDEPDSVREMAQTLFSGGCVDGDVALAEAALSAGCFYKLVDLGVPFPRSRYGEYIGYKTDHDPRRRATSAGPYTSRFMTECLERSVQNKAIKVFDRCQVIRILMHEGKLLGLLCLNLSVEAEESRFIVFNCRNVIYATGGPSAIYLDSVYPESQFGATGLAFEAGAMGRNLTEWQFGLASVRPRWNVSGTYMQVLPVFISTDEQGKDEREFLIDFFDDYGKMLTNVFMKGYQWPFDVRKIIDGSSIIDILVYIERFIKGRRVFLDFRNNPGGEEVDFTALSPEAYEYLEKAGALKGIPILRLEQMNLPAVEFYRDRGVDLYRERLEISLCAQHNNGGIAVDSWWQTNIKGFFAAGEAAASHGVYRPGGSALNAGQAGALRAAQYIAANRNEPAADLNNVRDLISQKAGEFIRMGLSAVGTEDNVSSITVSSAETMSSCGGAVRHKEGIDDALLNINRLIGLFNDKVGVSSSSGLSRLYGLYDILVAQKVYLSAMKNYSEAEGISRGSALYTDPNGNLPAEGLPEIFRFSTGESSSGSEIPEIQEIILIGDECEVTWRPPNPIPEDDDFFENVWRDFRETGNVY